QFLNLFWRAMGARLGSNTCIFASSLGSEFDLKTIGRDVVLQYQSLVFGHSIEHHSLLLTATTIENGAESGPFAIVETGAVLAGGEVVAAHMALHATRKRTERAEA